MPPSAPDAARSQAVARFVRALRWTAGVFAVVCVIAVVVLAVRAPDCIGIGISVLGVEDCTNRNAYYLILAASTGIVTLLTMLVFAVAYAVEVLVAIASERTVAARSDDR
jgi:hypothetical protein